MRAYEVRNSYGLVEGWVGTQQEAKDEVKRLKADYKARLTHITSAQEDACEFTPVDIPDDKPGLLRWINQHC